MFRKKILAILTVLMLFGATEAQAYPNWDIYSDTDIYDGNYNLINIYDTPPNSTTVNMYGGSADFVSTFDSSTLNFYDGNAEVGAFNTSIINISGGTLSGAEAWGNAVLHFVNDAYSQSLGVGEYGTVNMTGGTVDYLRAGYNGIMNLHGGSVIDSLNAWDSAAVNVFGYDLVKNSVGGSYNYGYVSGFWNNGIPFTINLVDVGTYDHINLITVVDVEIEIRPETLNLSSTGRWVTCDILIPDDYNAVDVNSASVLIQDEVEPDWFWFNEKQNILMVKFRRSALQEILEPGEVEITASGFFEDGTYFEGTDTIKVIDKGRKKK